MKLLLLVHGLPIGGTEVMACHLARRLRTRGLAVAVGCLDVVGELGLGLADDGFEVVCYGRRPGFDARLPLRIARHARRFGADVVHAHQYTPFFYGALARPLAAAGLVFTEHGRAHPDPPSRKRRAFNRVFAPLAGRVTAVSAGVRDALCSVEGFDASRIEIIPNGIELEPFAAVTRDEARRLLSLDATTPVVATVGRLDPVKNYPLLLEAFRRLRETIPDALLLVVGDGAERARLEALAAQLGLGDSVRFLGRRRDVHRLYAAFDVFALSSFSEGLPMTVIEAMAASVPVLATDVGGIREAIRDGQDGVLLPPPPFDTDPHRRSEYATAFATALASLLRDEPGRKRLTAAALRRARERFSLDAVCDRYQEAYAAVTPRR